VKTPSVGRGRTPRGLASTTMTTYVGPTSSRARGHGHRPVALAGVAASRRTVAVWTLALLSGVAFWAALAGAVGTMLTSSPARGDALVELAGGAAVASVTLLVAAGVVAWWGSGGPSREVPAAGGADRGARGGEGRR